MSQSLRTSPFEEAVGAEYVAEATAGDAIDGVAPRWVVEPGSVKEVVEVLKVAHQRDLTVIGRGLGRHLTLGNPPRRADVIVSLGRMNRVLAYEPADMTVRVQAGCSLVALGSALHENDQWLPLDPPRAPRTTIGGVLATNLAGPLRASQGTARDLLIGIRTVGPDGTVVSGGGKVVKNVAGYDLPKAHVGALGTLGIIVDATFKVRPRPQHEGALEISCSDGAYAAGLALELRDTCEPFWLQIANDGAPPKPWRVIVGAGGRHEEVVAAVESYRATAEARGALSRTVPNAAEVRRDLADASAQLAHVVLKAATLATRVGAWLDVLETAAVRVGATPRFHADLVCGVIRMSIDSGSAENLGELVAELRPRFEDEGGSLIVERATSTQKEGLSEVGGVWGDPGPGLSLMRGLKEAFDPAGRLAPGRYVGGL